MQVKRKAKKWCCAYITLHLRWNVNKQTIIRLFAVEVEVKSEVNEWSKRCATTSKINNNYHIKQTNATEAAAEKTNQTKPKLNWNCVHSTLAYSMHRHTHCTRLQTQRKIVCTLHFLYANFLAFVFFPLALFKPILQRHEVFPSYKITITGAQKKCIKSFLLLFVFCCCRGCCCCCFHCKCGKWAGYKVNKYKRHACVTGVWVSFSLSLHSDGLDANQPFVDHMTMMMMTISRWEWYRFRMHAYRTSNVKIAIPHMHLALALEIHFSCSFSFGFGLRKQ